jgi:hypothetical protein
MKPYDEVVAEFAKMGSQIYKTDPKQHYKSAIGITAKRPMEPGFIPPYQPAKIVTVSFYPNETELPNHEYRVATESLSKWGRTGSLPDYKAAYRDWVAMLELIPFYRDFNMPVFDALKVRSDEFAWLPLLKLPLPARSKVGEDDIWVDRPLLWDHLLLLKPPVILVQGLEAANVVKPMCEDKFPHRIVFQKIGRVGTNAYHQNEFDRVIRDLGEAMMADSR